MLAKLNQLKKKFQGEALRFIIVGIGATALHYGIYLILLPWINDYVAYSIGYIVSLVANYYFSNYFTFKTKPNVGNSLGFLGSHAVNFVVHLVLLKAFLTIGVSPQWAPIGVYLIAVPLNFVLVRLALKGR